MNESHGYNLLELELIRSDAPKTTAGYEDGQCELYYYVVGHIKL